MAAVLSDILPELEQVQNNSAFLDPILEGTEVLALGAYFPTHTTEFNSDIWSKLILDLKTSSAELNKDTTDKKEKFILQKRKEDQIRAIKFFAKTILGLLNPKQEFLVIGVPSSDKANYMNGSRFTAAQIAKLSSTTTKKIKCGNQYLIRSRSQAASHVIGSRSIESHLESLEIRNAAALQGKVVILIDDVTTSGNSMEATKQKLLSAGVAKVICIALARTVRCLDVISDETYNHILRVNQAIRIQVNTTIDKYDSTQKRVIRFNLSTLLEQNITAFTNCYNKVKAQIALQEEMKLQLALEQARLQAALEDARLKAIEAARLQGLEEREGQQVIMFPKRKPEAKQKVKDVKKRKPAKKSTENKDPNQRSILQFLKKCNF